MDYRADGVDSSNHARARDESGLSLVEVLVAMAILLTVSGFVMSGVMDLSRLSATTTNRTDMHAGVRNATALLAQEVGQAGRVTLPGPVALTADVAFNATTASVSSTDGMFDGLWLVFDTGDREETLQIASVDSETTLTVASPFASTHNANVPVSVRGGFMHGIVPPGGDGSDASVLKIFGDINGDGRMVYVEFTCDVPARNMYRNSMPFQQVGKPAPGIKQILLRNIEANPGGAPCFTYQTKDVSGQTFVIGVAITLTGRTERRDVVSGQFARETKALLNVSPRNVFNVWQIASLHPTLATNDRVQPTPPTILDLIKPVRSEADPEAEPEAE